MQFQFTNSNTTSSLKQIWQMYPDVFTYVFSQEEYHEHLESLKDSRYWMVDGMLPVKVSAARYYWEYVTGNLFSWLGFENRCEPQKLRMAAMKLLYFGYLNGFNDALDTSSTCVFDDIGLNRTYLQYCKKPRSNDYSQLLQADLIKHAKQNLKLSLPNDHYFGRTYARYNMFLELAKLDPQVIDCFKYQQWPTEVASVLELCQAALKNSTFESFITEHYMKECVSSMQNGFCLIKLNEIQIQAKYLQEKIPSFKETYHQFFIQLLLKSDTNLRKDLFSTYIRGIPLDVVFRYLKKGFFDQDYLFSLSNEEIRYYLKSFLIPYCKPFMSDEAHAQQMIGLMQNSLNSPEKVIDLLYIYDILVDIIKVDKQMSDLYIKTLINHLMPKQMTLTESVVNRYAWLVGYESAAVRNTKIMNIINTLDPLAVRSNEKFAAFRFERYYSEEKFNDAEEIYDCWKNQNKTVSELQHMFGNERVVFYQKKHAACDTFVDLEHGRVHPEVALVNGPPETRPSHAIFSWFSSSKQIEATSIESDARDVELGEFRSSFGSDLNV